MCPSVCVCVCHRKQHLICVFEEHHVKVIWRCGSRLSAARTTSFLGLQSPVTSESFLLKSSISPCQSAAQPHPKTSADSSIRALPIVCLTAYRHCSLNPQKKKPPHPILTISSRPLPFLSCSFLPLLLPNGFELLY